MIEFFAIFFLIHCTNVLARVVTRRRDVLYYVTDGT